MGADRGGCVFRDTCSRYAVPALADRAVDNLTADAEARTRPMPAPAVASIASSGFVPAASSPSSIGASAQNPDTAPSSRSGSFQANSAKRDAPRSAALWMWNREAVLVALGSQPNGHGRNGSSRLKDTETRINQGSYCHINRCQQRENRL